MAIDPRIVRAVYEDIPPRPIVGPSLWGMWRLCAMFDQWEWDRDYGHTIEQPEPDVPGGWE